MPKILYTPRKTQDLVIQYSEKDFFTLKPGFNDVDSEVWELVNEVSFDLIDPLLQTKVIIVDPSVTTEKMTNIELQKTLKDRATANKTTVKKTKETEE